MTEFWMLGPVEVWSAGRKVEVPGAAGQTVLAALLMDVGRPVSLDTLIARLWDAPPRKARDGLYVHLARLRGALAQAAAAEGQPPWLSRRSGGYLLDIEPDRVDLHRFRRLAAQERAAGRAGEQGSALLDEALALWHGDALAGLPGAWACRVRDLLTREQLDVVVRWAGARLQQGQPAQVIDKLRALVDEHPLVEPLAGHLMRALWLAGRGSEALECYAAIRGRLVDELGADPSPQLQDLYMKVLRGNLHPGPEPAGHVAAIGHSAAAEAASADAPPVPRQLPPDIATFTGRDGELRALDTLVAASHADPGVVIVGICGPAGVGKTALAVHWAHRVADQFPGGQLYVNLRGAQPEGPVVGPSEAVRGFLYALGVAPQHIPPGLPDQTALYRSLLPGRRLLVLLDNACDAGQIRPLLPGSPGCMVVVTSQNMLRGMIAAQSMHPLPLGLLSAGESHELLARRLGPTRLAAEPAAVGGIITACAGLPLALAIVAARAATHPRFPLHALAAELCDSRDRLDALTDGDLATDVRAVFSWSCRTLTPDAGRLFRLLGLHPGPDITVAAAASLASASRPSTRALLAELARANLIAERLPGRYTFHDLLRAYAVDLAHRLESGQERQVATRRMLDHYLHTAHAADRLLDPNREPINLTQPQPGASPEQLDSRQQALAWFTAEHRCLLAAVQHAASGGWDAHAWRLAWSLLTYLDWRGHWDDHVTVQRAAVAAAQRLADIPAEARARSNLARACIRLGRCDEAQPHLACALELYCRAGNRTGQAHTHMQLGIVGWRQGRLQEALGHERRALDLYRADGNQAWQARALNNLGWAHAHLGNFQQALTCCQQALALHQELANRTGQANTWDSLGYIHHHLGGHDEASACYRRALDLYRDIGDRCEEATTLTRLAETLRVTARFDLARAAWQRALDILTDLGRPEADQVRAKLATLGTQDPVRR